VVSLRQIKTAPFHLRLDFVQADVRMSNYRPAVTAAYNWVAQFVDPIRLGRAMKGLAWYAARLPRLPPSSGR